MSQTDLYPRSLTGMAGLTISDRILGRDLGLKMRNRFERCLEEEFTECDGRILPLRSEFTGLTVSTPPRNQTCLQEARCNG